METVNSLTSAASRAVFGTTATNTNEAGTAGQEPVSGQLGDVKKGEPYDKGNLETTEPGTEGEVEGQEPIAGKKGDVQKGEPFDLGNAGEFFVSLSSCVWLGREREKDGNSG